MLLIVLTVLKITGIVLLSILALLLLILLLVLFVPLFYRLDASVPRTDLDEGFDPETIKVKASFSWLLFVLRGGIDYPESKAFTLRVFGIRLLPAKKKEKETEKETEKEAEKETTDDTDEVSSDEKIEKTDNAEPKDGASEEKSFLDYLWNIIDGVENFLKTPQNVFEKIQYTISRVCDKISMIKATLENDIFKRAFLLVKTKLIKVIRMLLPDRFRSSLVLGTGDPATTAELMGVFAMLYPLLYNKVSFTPDFESKVIEGDVHLRGHITAFTIIYSAAVCYFNKDVKKVIKRFKKIANS